MTQKSTRTTAKQTSADPETAGSRAIDDYFARGHWIRKIWQTLIALIGWLAVIVPIVLTVTAFWATVDPHVWHVWSYAEGIFEIKFIGVLLLFAFVMASIFAVSMTIIQNRKRERLVEQWPTFNPLTQHKRERVLEQFMTERFGPVTLRENVRHYRVQPEQNLDTDDIHELFAQHDLDELDQ